MTVFVIQKPKPGPNGVIYDVGPAEEYGRVEYIFDAYENVSSKPAISIEKVRKVLDKFDDSTDYIVSAGGDPYSLFLTGIVMNELGHQYRWLRFERTKERPIPGQQQSKSSGYYVPIEMPAAAY